MNGSGFYAKITVDLEKADNLNRLTSVQQADLADAITAGWVTSPGTYTANTLAAKRVDFGYNALGQYTSISRYADLSGGSLVASTSSTYDNMERLIALTHALGSSGSTTLAYAFGYDANSQITTLTTPDGTSSESYDNNGQVTAASLTSETYAYDANGNRTSANGSTYGTPGANNQLTSDGTYTYTYDNEGNRLTRTNIATGQVDTYTWDYRNRLTDVVTTDASAVILQSVHYTYDTMNRRIGKTVVDGSSTVTLAENYVYDGSNLLLVLDGSGNVTQRYLNGPAENQVLVEETLTGSTSTVRWALTDQVGSIRDVADNAGAVLDHVVYDSFGNITSQTDSTNALRMGYTGQVHDAETGLDYYHARYYDPGTGSFIRQDPMGFAAGDGNLFRYVGNSPVTNVDPTGLNGAASQTTELAKTGPQLLVIAVTDREYKMVDAGTQYTIGGKAYFILMKMPGKSASDANVAIPNFFRLCFNWSLGWFRGDYPYEKSSPARLLLTPSTGDKSLDVYNFIKWTHSAMVDVGKQFLEDNKYFYAITYGTPFAMEMVGGTLRLASAASDVGGLPGGPPVGSTRDVGSANPSGVQIVEREGNTVVGSFKVAGGEARFVGDVVRDGDTLIIRGAHIEGDATLKEVYQMAEQYGREQGVKTVCIEGGRRTTGANPGHIPKPLVIEVK